MLFSTTTDVYAGLGGISTNVFADVWPYLVLVAGVPLAFFIIEMIIDLIRPDSTMRRADKAIADFEELHRQGKV